MDFLETILRFISYWLDNLVYNFVPTIYNLLMDIAETSIFTEEVFDMFASKVYGLLGIFMLFKVSFSILSYIVDPDAFLDKSKGFSKLISNVIITLALLITTPWIFSQAMEIQKIILRDNVLGKVFSTTSTNPNVVADAGSVMAYETFKAFYHFDYENDAYAACKSTSSSEEFNGDTTCQTALGISDNTKFENLNNTLNNAFSTQNIKVYMDFDLLYLKDSNDNYIMEYIPIISTVAGIALLLLLIVFCFDVALRSVKLGFLRMIAPVPIISRKKKKKGKETFDKWLKTTISTYLDLFIRLLAIYFAIFVITQVIDLKFVDATTGLPAEVNVFVKVFIILGALLFAKQLPQLVQDLTGIKMDGKFTLNPLKKLNETGVPGLAAVGAAGTASFIANAMEARGPGDTDPSIFRRISSGFGGMGSAMLNTGKNVIKNKGEKNFDSFRSGVSIASNNRRMREGGYGVITKMQDAWTDMSGHKFSTGTSSMLKNDINNMEIDLQNIKQSEEAARRTFYESLNGTSSAVRDYFDFSFDTNADGKFSGYTEKSLDDFLSIHNISRNDLGREEIAAFENMLANYNAVTSLDTKGRDIEKQIKDKKEQMENSKKKNG